MSDKISSWRIAERDQNLSICEQILANRGINTAEARNAFFDLSPNQLHDPFLLDGMKVAINRIKQAIDENQKIIIFGDYDVDGITSTAILFLVLQDLGATVSYRLPHRINDGYGLNSRFIKELAEVEANLIITVDCGISCAPEVAEANALGIDVIVTDHHAIPEKLPDALAILHPKLPGSTYPDRELTGAGVAFKLASALIQTYFPQSEWEERILSFSDLASMGTVADCAPITDENRVIVSQGLKQLGKSSWLGINALKDTAGIKAGETMSTYHIGFVLGPRINAVGRISNPYFALQMILSKQDKAYQLAQKLETVNRERQELTKKMTTEAEIALGDKIKSQKVLMAAHESWHAGVIGLVAGRLNQTYDLPVIIMQIQEDKVVGSCRSPKAFDCAKALKAHEHLLDRFGGHKQAAGFSLKKENLETFIQEMETYAIKSEWDAGYANHLEIDAEVKPEELNMVLYNQLERLRPFGIGNEQPLFKLGKQKLSDLKAVGRDKTHLSGKVKIEGSQDLRFIGFSLADKAKDLSNNSCLDVACNLEINEFRGHRNLQLRLVDISA